MAVEMTIWAQMDTSKQAFNFKPQSYSISLNKHTNTVLCTNKLATMKIKNNENKLYNDVPS